MRANALSVVYKNRKKLCISRHNIHSYGIKRSLSFYLKKHPTFTTTTTAVSYSILSSQYKNNKGNLLLPSDICICICPGLAKQILTDNFPEFLRMSFLRIRPRKTHRNTSASQCSFMPKRLGCEQGHSQLKSHLGHGSTGGLRQATLPTPDSYLLYENNTNVTYKAFVRTSETVHVTCNEYTVLQSVIIKNDEY